MLDPELLRRIAALEQRLGCPLGDPERVVEALTHKSYANEARDWVWGDNERLEFLGDAVVGLAIRQRLMEQSPEADEGTLSRMHSGLVNGDHLAELGRRLGLGELLLLGRGEERTGGREKPSVVSDAFEAVLGVVYLSGGMSRALEVVDRLFSEALQRARAGGLERDFKTDLPEGAQARLKELPRYHVVGQDGPDHAKTFSVQVELGGATYGRGTGRSKKEAEQAAALEALARLPST